MSELGNLAKDNLGRVMPLLPSTRALASTRNTAVTTSAVEFTLNTNTTILRLRTTGASIYLNYASTADDTVTTSSFDCFVPADGGFVDVKIPNGTTKINAITDTGTVAPFIILEY